MNVNCEDCPKKPLGEDGPALILKNSIMSYYVYLIRSIKFPQTTYAGYTINIEQRLETHNSGGSIHTAKDRPWELVVCTEFKNMNCAKEFEKYLKSQSGRAFDRKRFW